MTTREDRILGCLVGGAVGDALGAPVEFMTIQEIRTAYGSSGIDRFEVAYDAPGHFTDDTQMTLFSAEGLIRHNHALQSGSDSGPVPFLYNAYLRWLFTQGIPLPDDARTDEVLCGWLVTEEDLHARRAPGSTCISSLRSGVCGDIGYPPNSSKGCGGVMRAAPAAFTEADPFDLGCRLAAITHGHPAGYLSAGAFALIINAIVEGSGLADAVLAALERLESEDFEGATVDALSFALDLATHRTEPTPETIAELGSGWTADEALAISVFCALEAKDFSSGVLAAVNHSGDSDSTGSMTGNLLGTLLGADEVPGRWRTELQARDIIEKVAGDLGIHTADGHDCDAEDRACYPPS